MASIVLVAQGARDARALAKRLEEDVPLGAEVRIHDTPAAAIEGLRKRPAEIVLLDVRGVRGAGLEGLAALQAAGVEAPIIVLGERDDDEAAIGAIRAGAHDRLAADDPAALARVVHRAVERRRAQLLTEELLRAKEDRWRSVTQFAPVGIVELEADGRCVFANTRVCELLGRAPADVLAHGWLEAVYPDDRPSFDRAWRAAVDGDGELGIELRFQRPDGQVIWAQVTAVVVRDPWGSLSGWLGTIVDITAARRARADLAAAERAVLAIAELARETSVADDPVGALCAGAQGILGAERVDFVPEGDVAAGGPGIELHPVVRGGERLGVLCIRWADAGGPASGSHATLVDLLAAELGAAIERRRLLDRLRELARTDPLTGLPNRRAWDERLDIEMARSRRSGHPLTVAMLDLDRFKAYNDTHGHQAGDRLLADTAAAWRELLRASDLLCRLGGDEFALLLPDCDPKQATEIIARLQGVLDPAVGCSAGVAGWDHDEDPESLIARADSALYEQKARGRGSVTLAS